MSDWFVVGNFAKRLQSKEVVKKEYEVIAVGTNHSVAERSLVNIQFSSGGETSSIGNNTRCGNGIWDFLGLNRSVTLSSLQPEL